MGKASLSYRIIPFLLLPDGISCVFIAIFAYELGLDPNTDWSSSRFVLLFFGITLILISVFFFNKTAPILDSENLKTLFLLAHIWAVIFTVYAWFITYGNFTTWDHTTHYYTQLADGFNKGHLYLDREPSKALLEAVDPNNPNDRPAFDDEVWDLSLYKGKFYLYWGPVPALLIAPLQRLLAAPIMDIYLVYFFSVGLLVFNSLIILNLWRRFFPHIFVWNVFPCIPLIGFILPIPWSLNVPQVYEAAIGTGQFFLMGGIYFTFLAFEKDPPNKKYLFLAGIFWACSVGSRAINVFSVIFFAALVSFWIVRGDLKGLGKPVRSVEYIKTLLPFFIPLVFGALAIGWYNWARFDSPFEFGLRYQITLFNLKTHTDWVFRPDYFPLNVYNYIFQPFEIISRFPFVKPLINTDFPETYFYAAGPVTGLLFSAPFLIFILGLFFSRKNEHPQTYYFFVYLLAGSFVINLLTILFYFFSQTRFLVDLISQITLLAILGYWQLVTNISNRNFIASKVFVTAANLLVIATICLSILLSFSSETNRMETLNPQLIEKIDQFFTK